MSRSDFTMSVTKLCTIPLWLLCATGSAVQSAPSPTPQVHFLPEQAPWVHDQIVKPRTPAEIARTAFPSVVLLATEDEQHQPLSLGSGFFINKNIVVTNLHVIDGAAGGYAKIIGEVAKLNIEGIAAIDSVHDLVLLQLSASAAVALPVARSITIATGDPIYAVGNPRGLEGTFSQGIVSSVRQIGSDRLLQITAPISPGSSGGPVLDQTGIVVGVSVASVTNGQNLNFAIPSEYVVALQGVKPDLRPLRGIPRAAPRKSLLDRIGTAQPKDGIIGTNLTYDHGPSGFFSFSLQNQLRESVKNITGIIVFYSIKGEPLDIAKIEYNEVIPAGLARRLTGRVESSVEMLNAPDWQRTFPPKPQGKVEFRIFDFSIGEQ